MNNDETMEMTKVDAAELERVEGGYYGPCGCIPFPFPYPECPPAGGDPVA